MSGEYDPDHFSRTTLILGRQSGDAVVGKDRHRSFRVLLIAGDGTCSTRTGQAALLTAVMTAARAFNEVTVFLASPDSVILGGPRAASLLGETIASEGARLVTDVSRAPRHVIVVGDLPAGLRPEVRWVTATWSGWIAAVAPIDQRPPGGTAGQRSPGGAAGHLAVDVAGSKGIVGNEDNAGSDNVLAAIAAGSLAVAQVFFAFMDDSGRDSAARRVCLNLWTPGSSASHGPRMAHAPSQWWLLGLGHLGQGYAHVISWLDYADPGLVQVVLQDTQRAVPANHSTGVLTPREPHDQRKTRIVGSALERCGLDTVIIERRMDERTPARAEDMHVALVGVDNLHTRRHIDRFGWKTAIDVGLGAGARDFDGMTVRRFPGRPSAYVPAWQEQPPTASQDQPALAVRSLGPCGVAELNGVAVGASFVGVIAGAVAVAETTRVLHGGSAHAVMCHDLRDDELDGASTDQYVSPVAARLR